MLLNLDKSSLLEFSMRQSSVVSSLSDVRVGGVSTPLVQQARFVGFTFDRGLQWREHIEGLCAKLNSAYYAISRLASTLSRNNLLTAYYGYFHSHLSYGIDLWGLSVDRDRPFILQKKAIRKIARLPDDDPAKQHFIDLKILTVPCLYILEVGTYVRRNINEFPKRSWFGKRACKWRDVPLDTKPKRLQKTNKSLLGMGPRIYNKIPVDVRNCLTESGFTRKFKSWLSQKAYYSVDQFLDDEDQHNDF
ncbi:hypothetical protein NE865_08551 [Phthorimaea operculella]|nr:hypothetical protein NE865_08551 [Phthorimaea operculella]